MERPSELALDLIEALESLRRSSWPHDLDSAMPVTPSEMHLLLYLYHRCDPAKAGMQPSELGDLLQIARPTVSSLVNSLEEKGFVERRNSTSDRRAVLVCLTKEGIELIAQAHAEMEKHIGRLVEFLGVEDTQELIRLIRRVQQFRETERRTCGN
ncbi:MAG: MarR family transcriptional regulator [Firmicutes bacterium]|jgi:DNA-binding MarR family transcriptional regulator|nr:MarR family transcriptional regulator [Bacillota bacterium]